MWSYSRQQHRISWIFVSPDLLWHPPWYTPLLIPVQIMSWWAMKLLNSAGRKKICLHPITATSHHTRGLHWIFNKTRTLSFYILYIGTKLIKRTFNRQYKTCKIPHLLFTCYLLNETLWNQIGLVFWSFWPSCTVYSILQPQYTWMHTHGLSINPDTLQFPAHSIIFVLCTVIPPSALLLVALHTALWDCVIGHKEDIIRNKTLYISVCMCLFLFLCVLKLL